MSAVESPTATYDIADVHGLLVSQFTERYRAGLPDSLQKLIYCQPYDPDEPICDYDSTYWESRPVPFVSEFVGRKILGMMHRLDNAEINSSVVAPFAERAADIAHHSKQYPLAFINGHEPNLQAAMTMLGEEIATSHFDGGIYQKRLVDNIRNTRVIGTRGFVPIRIDVPVVPLEPRLAKIARLLMSPHFSFPITKQMINAGLPRDFIKQYNTRFKQEAVEVGRRPLVHPKGYNIKWKLSPGGGPDDRIGEGADEIIATKLVIPATVDLLKSLGVGLVPVYTSFGLGKRETRLEIGKIIEPRDVNQHSIDTVMSDLAEFRRNNGEDNVWYAGEIS